MNMIKVLVVEDKYITRKGLIRDIDWQTQGFEVVGEAANGADALDMIPLIMPNLVITDIMMPVLDGLGLLEKTKHTYPDLYFLIISGHDEFEYAQRALKLGAFDYVLKPINMQDFLQVLQNVKTSFEQRRAEQNRVLTLESKISESLETQRQKLFQELIFNQIDPGSALIRAQTIKVPIDCLYFVVILAKIDKLEIKSFGLDYLQLMDLDHQFGKMIHSISLDIPQVTVIETQVGERILCISAETATEVKALVSRLCSNFQHDRLDDAILLISDVHNEANSLKLAYSETLEISKRRFLKSGPTIYRYQDMKNEFRIDENHFINYDDQELISMIKTGNISEIERQIEKINKLVRKEGISSHLQMLMIAASIYFRIINIVSEIGGGIEEVFINPSASFNKLLYQQNIEGMLHEIREISFKVADYINARKSGRFDQVLKRAQEYIAIHYSNENISLDDVAQFAMVSSSYLSMILRQEAKKTFIELLTEVRMKHASDLLQNTDLKTYEIGLRSGYSNPTYFSTIFKKFFGVTPSAYRNLET
jgi:two-component system response regulator YesN